MLRILGRANASKVRMVLWLMGELGLPYEQEDWGRGYRSTSEPEFQRLSPFARVPIVIDDGLVIREAGTILRYLARKSGRTDFLPTDLAGAAEVEAWMDWGGSDLFLGARPVYFALVVKSPVYRDPGVIETGIADWSREMRALDRHLATNGPYLTGERLTLADIVVGVFVHRWFAIDFAKPHFAAAMAYYERLSARPHYQRHVRNGSP
jgi:glutathione S-transferase